MARAVLLMLICNVVGGLTYPWQKAALEGLPPATITVIRTTVALLCMAVLLRRRGGGLRWPWDRAETRRLLVVGSAGLALPLLLGAYGVERSTAANGSILILLEPVFILVFSHLLLRERVGGLRGAGVALGLVGALCVLLEDLGKADLLGGGHLAGNLMLAASAVCWGLYSPVIAPLTRRHGAAELSFAVLLVGQAVFVPAAALEAGRWEGGPALLPAVGYAVLLGVAASFLGTVLWNEALRTLPAPVVAPFVLLQPAVGTLGGVLMLGESLSPWALRGAAIAAAGVLLVLYGERRSAARAA